jgi:hypothetical protein
VPSVVPPNSNAPISVHLPPELAKVVSAWPDLPAVVKAGILAMIEAAGESQSGR